MNNKIMFYIITMLLLLVAQYSYSKDTLLEYSGFWQRNSFDQKWTKKNFKTKKFITGGISLSESSLEKEPDSAPCTLKQPLLSYFSDSSGKRNVFQLDCISACPDNNPYGRLGRIHSFRAQTIKNGVKVKFFYKTIGPDNVDETSKNKALNLNLSKKEWSFEKTYSLSQLTKTPFTKRDSTCEL